jgi:hypothetical protein
MSNKHFEATHNIPSTVSRYFRTNFFTDAFIIFLSLIYYLCTVLQVTTTQRLPVFELLNLD